MKRFIFCVLLLFVILYPAMTQSLNFTEFEGGFNTFAAAFANSLPFNALIGQQWSDAFIGSFFHLGAGATLGATTIPYEDIAPILTLFNITLPAELNFLSTYGVPIPAYSIDARLGIPVIPLDVGVKFGMLPSEVKTVLPDNLALDYFLIGADARYCLLKSNLLLPEISVGLGYSYLRGSFGISGLLGTNPQIGDVNGHTISLQDPSLNLNWETSVIDLKVQISKDILFITPFIGMGAAYGISTAGGGLESEVLLDGNPIQQADIIAINDAMGDAAPDLSTQGIAVSSAVNGWSARVFGGIGLNIFVIKLDIGAMLNLTSKAYGVMANLRIQL